MNIVYNGEMDSRAFKDVLGKTIPELAENDLTLFTWMLTL